MHNYKYFFPCQISSFGGISEADDMINKYEKDIPKLKWISGRWKDQSGFFACSDPDLKEFSGHDDSQEFEGATFFAPKQREGFPIDNFTNPNPIKCRFKMVNGSYCELVPAMAIPKKLLLGKFGKKTKLEESKYKIAKLYNRQTEYGRLAYDLLHLLHKDENQITTENEDVLKLVNVALKYTYDLPLDVINWYFDFNEQDLHGLFMCAMGGDIEFLKKDELPEGITI